MNILFVFIISLFSVSVRADSAAQATIQHEKEVIPAYLLTGTIPYKGDSTMKFWFESEDSNDPLKGYIFLNGVQYEISSVSRLGLIGARRFVKQNSDVNKSYAEFLVLSSSFSEQTAIGTPWLAAHEVYGCDTSYNTYLAFYQVKGEKTVKALGPIPYESLAENLSNSQHSWISCFQSAPSS